MQLHFSFSLDTMKFKRFEKGSVSLRITTQLLVAKLPYLSFVGPDGISYRHLKQLGPVAIGALTDIFNLSIQYNTIPKI